jgi:hypothetical protein
LVEKIRGTRFSSAFMTVNVELECGVTPFIAGGHMDKKPMLLVGTCGMSTPGETVVRERRQFKQGAIQKTRYTATQPHMHDLYRKNFNAVDLFNRSCFGNFSVQFSVMTKSWTRRMFLAMLGMCETNAQNAYKKVVGPVERYQWLTMLADKLINNPWYVEEDVAGPSEPPQPTTFACGNYVRLTGRSKCHVCKKLTQWRCKCGKNVCRAGTSADREGDDCYFRHLRETFTGMPVDEE